MIDLEFIKSEGLIHDFLIYDEDDKPRGAVRALDGVSVSMEKGRFIAIVGSNGSGKSTFARHLDALLLPTKGKVTVDGMDTADESRLWEIRTKVGMVFQNPDNQMVAGTVEEEVAFGPENLAIPSDELRRRVTDALAEVRLSGFEKAVPTNLSGGQKQQVAIAGVIAMGTECIVLDEPTAMLDPQGRRLILGLLTRLCREEGMSVILITQNMEECAYADEVIVFDKGKIAARGTPAEIFSDEKKLSAWGLELPPYVYMAKKLSDAGVVDAGVCLTKEELADAVIKKVSGRSSESLAKKDKECAAQNTANDSKITVNDPGTAVKNSEIAVSIENVSFSYTQGAREVRALQGISLEIPKGCVFGIAGATGSGKSTLAQIICGLKKPGQGEVMICVGNKRRPGMVFQYPESQLFDATVFSDVCYGPKNLGMSEEEMKAAAGEALCLVGLPKETWDKSPFTLSGGQKRRAAIAGVLSMKPEILVLDEPAAGLDPLWRKKILDMVHALSREKRITVIMITHSMNDAAKYTDMLAVMKEGRVLACGRTRDVLTDGKTLSEASLLLPDGAAILEELSRRGFDAGRGAITPDEAVCIISEAM